MLSISTRSIQALEILFNSTKGEQWQWANEAINGPKWTFTSPQADPCNDQNRVWQGITCSSVPSICQLESCEIVSLILNAYNLEGTLPSQFFVQLSTLRIFKLSASVGLVGSLPSEIASLSRLSAISLADNQLTGGIPSEICSLSQLTVLNLYNNLLTGAIPSEISSLNQLDVLSFDNNELTGVIPTQIGSLSRLGGLYLDNNQLTGAIPSEMGSLSRLSVLYLDNNQLTGAIPSEIGFLTRLTVLSLHNNQLTGGIPSEICSLSGLDDLNLYNNQLTGAIPTEIGSLSQLSVLSLDINQLTGVIPTQIASLSRLDGLYLRNNQLTGGLPSEIGSLLQLRILSLYNNQLTGSMPPEIGSLPRLSVLSLYNNQLSGTIPSEISSLSQLSVFHLYSNQLTGSIPSEMGSLSKLDGLYIYNNHLTGALPTTIGSLTQLSSISLSNNQLTGAIPSEIGSLSRLSVISLHTNYLTAVIPSEIGSISQLGFLSLHTNQLTGAIPAQIGWLFRLGVLYLDNNQLTGAIPSEIGFLTRLTVLSLHNNQLTGGIPLLISNLFSLVNFHVHRNRLNGPITFQLTSFPRLQQLFLHHNSFTGPLDDLFSSSNHSFSSSGLLNLDVSDNLFSGSIPSTLFLASQLQSISLSLNCFEHELPQAICVATGANVISMDGLGSAEGCHSVVTLPFTSVSLVRSIDGKIPDCVWSMSNLKMLNLAGNGLRGRIGSTSSMSSLLSLALSHNHLSGEIPLWLAEKNMLHLDLSHNKLTGDADSFKHQDNFNNSFLSLKLVNQSLSKSLTLSVNRLSGDLPSSFGRYADLDILSGNLFGCSHLPKNDDNSDSLSCGSEQYDQSMSLMQGVFGIAFCLIAMYHLLCLLEQSFRSRDRKTKDNRQLVKRVDYVTLLRYVRYYQSSILQSESKEEMNPFPPNPHPFQSTVSFGSLLFQLMWSMCLLTALCLLLSLPIYVLKQFDVKSTAEAQYVTHTHMYNWLWTMAFVSGTTPAIILLVTSFVCLLYFNAVMNLLGKKDERVPSSTTSAFPSALPKPLTDDRGRFVRITAVWVVFALNIIVVGTVNGLYIWSTLLDLAREVQVWIQLAFALFSFLWSAALRIGLPSRIKESRYGIWLFICLNAINSVMIPCAVTALSTPSCYQVSLWVIHHLS
jgi:Leucine-rich repeat (LRR) protein